MSGPEELQITAENKEQVQNSAENRLDQLSSSAENSVELSQRDIESRIEKARHEALEKASNVATLEKEKRGSEKKSLHSRKSTISKKDLDKSYRQTIKQVQAELSPSSRVFSKIIHNGFVEKTSDVLGNTVARPNALLFGSIFAFLLTLIIYTYAKTIGYPLSGSETIVTFAVGWLIGVVIDYLKILFTGNR